MKTYIIAEAGVNHNGNLDLAIKLIDKAKEAGADCIKFQTFKTESLILKTAPKADYQLKTTDAEESQFNMLKKLELSYENFSYLNQYCKKIKIDFMSTPYSFEDIDFLNNLGVNSFKIASGQLTEIPFLKYVAKTNKKIILSTGMSDLSQIYNATEVIKANSNGKLIVLQCTTNYPSNIEDSNLNCMRTIREACEVEVGYSDHVIGNHACFAAVALGATVIEKHFTLDKSMPGPDHSCSSNPEELKDLINGIREIEKSLGSKSKKPTKIEIINAKGMKRSLVTKVNIKKGEKITEEHITFKRPSGGLDVNYYDLILNKTAKTDILKDTQLNFDLIKW